MTGTNEYKYFSSERAKKVENSWKRAESNQMITKQIGFVYKTRFFRLNSIKYELSRIIYEENQKNLEDKTYAYLVDPANQTGFSELFEAARNNCTEYTSCRWSKPRKCSKSKSSGVREMRAVWSTLDEWMNLLPKTSPPDKRCFFPTHSTAKRIVSYISLTFIQTFYIILYALHFLAYA